MNDVMTRPVGQPTIGLVDRIKEAVGPRNFHNIHEAFASQQFKLMVGSAHEVRPFLVPCLEDEDGYHVIERIVSSGYIRGNTYDLANYVIRNLPEIKKLKLAGILAMSDDSQWDPQNGEKYAPYAFSMPVKERSRFGFFQLSSKFTSRHAVIVFGPK